MVILTLLAIADHTGVLPSKVLTTMSFLASMERSEKQGRNLHKRTGLQIRTIKPDTVETRDIIIVAVSTGQGAYQV